MSDLVEQAKADLLNDIKTLRLTARPKAAAKIRAILSVIVEEAATWEQSTAAVGYKNPRQLLAYWHDHYPEVQQLRQRCMDFAQQQRGDWRRTNKSAVYANVETLAAHSAGLLYDPDRIYPALLNFTDFRWEYLGFPTAPHHAPAVAAMEDMTNNAIFIFGPPGMGKDTLATHYAAWRAPHRQQTAFFMSSEKFSVRRGRRIESWLINPQTYRVAPGGVPGGQVPTRSMIYDFGPFKWEKGMKYPDGSEVPFHTWNQTEKFYVSGGEAEELEPNLWFSGVSGSTYGSRIQDAILSDLWPPEKILGPDELEKDFTWVQDTLETRLDDDGRLIVLGTMLPYQNNYVRMTNEYTDGAVIIFEDEHTQKWSNGVCVVKIKAINYEEGLPVSYWPVKFPLEAYNEVTYKDGTVKEIPSDDHHGDEVMQAVEDQKKGVVTKIRHRRGLLDRQRRNPVKFRAIYQQEDVTLELGDFTDSVLRMAEDPDRTFGRYETHETLVLGVDPAKSYGAGWWLWAVSRQNNTMTLVDYGFHEQLGTQGIKDRLIVEPITLYNPAVLAYEINKHEAVLDDPIVTEILRDFGVKVVQHRTGSNRPEVGILATLMRMQVIRFPSMTREDQLRLELVRNHFKHFDLATMAERRSRPGQKTHLPDDLALAAWIGSIPAREILDGKHKGVGGLTVGVPDFVREKWLRRRHNGRNQPKHLTPGQRVSGMEVATMIATSWNER